MQVSACTLEYDERRSRAFARRVFTDMSKQGPSALRSTCAVQRPARVATGGEAHRADSESDSGVPGSDHGTSEVGMVRRRLDKIREGSRRVSILDAEKASARGASKRDCPKLATANSFADSPLP